MTCRTPNWIEGLNTTQHNSSLCHKGIFSDSRHNLIVSHQHSTLALANWVSDQVGKGIFLLNS